jgi:hypothetical protein
MNSPRMMFRIVAGLMVVLAITCIFTPGMQLAALICAFYAWLFANAARRLV